MRRKQNSRKEKKTEQKSREVEREREREVTSWVYVNAGHPFTVGLQLLHQLLFQ